ncbi:MAG: HipA domain-containing protein [Verrucomicrobia bacterium]|nr:HipA domain-containing protein [Verrucomicrobiota bacterium]
MSEPYSIFEIQPEWVLEPEGMGSKEKFWYRAKDGEPEWLFKFPQPNTGQHWAEKIAAEVAACMDVLHGVVELAVFQGTRGSATESFARDGRELFHGNQILAGKVHGYDPSTKFRHCDHTLANIFLGLERTFIKPEGAHRAKVLLAEYLVLDAVVGNTDRHHENWGIMRRQVGDRWQGLVAPSFDHASSLGRELRDLGEGKSRKQILGQHRISNYSEKAPGAIYWDKQDKRGLSPLELVRRGAALHPELFKSGLAKQAKLERPLLEGIIARVPADWMSPLAREFAVALMCYNLEELRKIQV